MEPFTIRLKDRTLEQSHVQKLRLKLDPGAKTTGMAIIDETNSCCGKVIFLAEIKHKQGIKTSMDARRNQRRSRRSRKTRYHKPRFLNRNPEKCASCGRNSKHGSRYCRLCLEGRNLTNNGYRRARLPVSLEARVNQTLNVIKKLMKLIPLSAISTEHVKFDTQLLQDPEIKGVEYQQGELFGYEVREYLLEKWGRKCAYCGRTDVPLEIEHIIPRSRGGTNRLSNLTLACHECNQKKGNLTAEEFGYPEIQKQAKKPLKDAVMMNATRWALYKRLKETNLPVECGTGARTKKQRIEQGLPKTHYYDACCAANVPDRLVFHTQYVSVWTSVGRGTRRMCNPDKYGFPRGHRQRRKLHFGFQTGDMVKAEVPKGKYAGIWIGRVAVRASGSFDLKDNSGRRICQGINYRYCQQIQRSDGWQYNKFLRKEGTQ
jgi:5-methylcytosine-specific restriction endonuclease McrA